MHDFAIRSSPRARLANSVLLAAGGVAASAVTAALVLRGSIWALGGGLALAVWVAYYYRLASLAVVASGDVLKVRNLFATRRLHRSAVLGVGLGESRVAKTPNQTVVLDLAGGGRLALDACARSVTRTGDPLPAAELRERIRSWAELSDREEHLQTV